MLPLPVLFAGTLVVWVLVPPGGSSSSAVEGAKASLKAALPNDTIAEVHVVTDLPDDAAQTRATSMATMVWSADGRTVTLRVRKESDARPLQRELTFDARDSAKERGRAAGFAIASMWSDDGGDPAPPEKSATSPQPSNTDPQKSESGEGIERHSTAAHDAGAIRSREQVFALDAALTGGVGFGGAAGGVGGGIGARYRLGGPLWIQGLARLRRGEMADVRATSTFTTVGGGVYVGGGVGGAQRFALGVRSEVLLEWQYLSHFSGDEPESIGEGRVLPVFGVNAEGAFRISESIELWVSAGPQLATGKTRLYLKSLEVSHVPVVRGLLDLGFRAYF